MSLYQEISKEVAKELGMNPALVEKIAKSQFEFVRNTMEKGEFETVRLPYLVKFMVKPYRLQKVNENYGTFHARRKSSKDQSGIKDDSSIQETDNKR